MPIRPENRARYPENWSTEVRPAIIKRAKDQCEGSPKYPHCRARNGKPHPVTGSLVVLTIAHLDHTPENCEPSNLRAWCQRCHLSYDAEHHAATRRARKAQNAC
jgi:5-methylcytosine-specific restriction endonuclease McrA